MIINKVIGNYKNLSKDIYILFIARVVNSMGNFVMPFLTLLLTTKMGMNESTAGKFLLFSSILQGPGSLIGGKLSDTFGRKKIIVIFMTLAAFCYIPCAFIGFSIIVPLLLIASSFFHSIASPSSAAMLNDITKPENRQQAFSLLYLGINMGMALGAIIAGFLFNNYLKIMYIGDSITTLIAVLLILLYVKESKPTKIQMLKSKDEYNLERAEEGGLFNVLLKRPEILFFSFINIIYSFVYAQHTFSLPLQTKAVFGSDIGAKYFGTLMTTNCLVVIFMTAIIINITSKYRPIFNTAAAGIFYAVGFGILYFIKDYKLYILSTIIWTIGEILNSTNANVYIANHTPISHRGRFNSIIGLITGIGFAVSPYISGKFISKNSIQGIWILVFSLSLAASFFMVILGIIEKRQEKNINYKI